MNNQLVSNPFYGVITDPTSPLSLPTVARGQLLKPYPQYTALNAIFATRGNSIYHSFQAGVEKRFSLGFSVQVAYTAGKMIDDSSQAASGAKPAVENPTNLRAERSIDAQDVAQRLVISGLFELPFGRGRLRRPHGAVARCPRGRMAGEHDCHGSDRHAAGADQHRRHPAKVAGKPT